uniref:Uncharacterized protein n=1 Tax=Aegilops tauschii subsp. strangulata TaxID=200361 RepID=A0A453AZ29_AEGTS
SLRASTQLGSSQLGSHDSSPQIQRLRSPHQPLPLAPTAALLAPTGRAAPSRNRADPPLGGAGDPAAAMAASDVPMSPELEQVDGEIQDIFRALHNGFQKIDKMKDSNRQSKQLEELTGKMRECKRLIKEFDRVLKDEEKRNTSEVNKQLNDKKQFMIKELNSYVTMRKT